MKMLNKTYVTKLSEKFDRQLLSILSQELGSIKASKNKIIKKLTPEPDNGLMVA